METTNQPTVAVDAVDLDAPTAAARAADARVVLDRYRLVRRIGKGGFGTVWLAHDERLDRAVAVKRIPVEGTGARTRAEREGRAAARLSHHGVVALYEVGHDDDAVYLVSELVRGRTLAQLLEEGALSDRDALEVGIALCDALAHAHGRGVIHRDVKPANVIVPDEYGPPTGAGVPRAGRAAKLTDFGIARMLGDDALTATGDVVGTIAYMAPEQAEGKPITEAADLYAAALVSYEALCGINPIRRPGAAATARRVGVRLPPLARLRRDLPGPLCRAIDRAVAPDPAARGTLTDLQGALERALPDVGDEPGPVEPARLDVFAGHTARAAARVEELTGVRAWPSRPEYPLDPLDGPVVPEPPSPELEARSRVAARVAAGAAAGLLVAAVLVGLGPVAGGAPAPPVVGAAAAAGLVALLPRAGWILTALAILGWLGAGAPGVALLVALLVLPVPTLLPWAGGLWSTPAGAGLLGLLGLGPAWPALAGQCRHVLDRAALAALGAWWALLAMPLLGRDILVDAVPGMWPAARWHGSAADAVSHVLVPIATSGLLLVPVLWAVAAAILPLLVRGRSFAVDAVGAALWATGLATGGAAILRAVDPSGTLHPRGVVVGAVVAALLAVGARAVRGDP